MLLYLHEDDLAFTYRTVEDRGLVVLITHPRDRLLATCKSHVVKGPDRVLARVLWSQVPVRSVRYQLDRGPSAGLAALGDGLWSGPIEGAGLAKGEHELTVVANADSGADATARLGFMIDPTGRYTAVPEARPLVTSTASC